MRDRTGCLIEVVCLIVLLVVWAWFDSCYADDCRRRGGTVIRGGSNGTMCIEQGER